MAIKYLGSGNGDGDSLTIRNDYIFDSTADRDTYFSTNSSELKEDLYCVSDSLLYKYIGSVWVDVSTTIQGSKGESGQSTTIEYSIDDINWHETLDPDVDTYVRFSVDGGVNYTAGAKFMGADGEDGDSVDIEYSVDGVSWHTVADDENDTYIRFSKDNGNTYSSGFKFVGTDAFNTLIEYSAYGDSDWHTTQTDDDNYWRWSIDGGDTWSDDFVRFSANVNVDIATTDDAGIVKPDGTTILIAEDGTISTDVAAATKVVVADEAEMLALPEITNLYIATRTDLEQIYYLNADTDPTVLANWDAGASVADTVASFTGADGTTRVGAVEASTGDYKLDMVQTEDTSTGTTYYLEVTDGALYLVEV